LVLLDINLPRRSGHEVLEAIKRDPLLRRIPVVMLTSSAAESDLARSRALGADGYVTKPVDLDDYLRVVRTIDDLWRAAAHRPRPSPPTSPRSPPTSRPPNATPSPASPGCSGTRARRSPPSGRKRSPRRGRRTSPRAGR